MVDGHDDSGNGQRLGARRMAMCAPVGRVDMVVGVRVRGAAVGDAMCIGCRGGVEEGRVVGVAALGYRRRAAGGPCLPALDLVEDAVARVGCDALELPFKAKLAVHEGDVVELVERERERECGVSGEEMGEMGADAGRVGGEPGPRGAELGTLRGRRAGRDGESRRRGLEGLERRRAVSRRVGHGGELPPSVRGLQIRAVPYPTPTSTRHRQRPIRQRGPARPQIPARRAQVVSFPAFPTLTCTSFSANTPTRPPMHPISSPCATNSSMPVSPLRYTACSTVRPAPSR
jgi:hypothetical protein